MIKSALEIIETEYKKMIKARSVTTRKKCGDIILKAMEIVPETKKYWGYNPDAFYWQDRFFKIGEENTTKIEVKKFIDEVTDLKNAPNFGGLYFLGSTHFNPITNECFFAVKIGLSNNINKRMKQYRTNCAMIYPIEYKECEDYEIQERKFQRKLSRLALYANQNNDEWYFVSKEIYLELCNKGFAYFD